MLEHQSTSDSRMALRLAEYEIAFWRRWVKANPKSHTVPMVLPVVLLCDPDGGSWTAPSKPRLGLDDLRSIMRCLGILARAGGGELEAALT
ncbi:Rpn family recombination-promoting nuclease/putative transposase [Nocardia yamanashiensis]|uniref:Rpn family recombination-promoting nuclease/putative transposase n=1 Tax=Nocardia yamanashiensis TaxID=209247 RepID=UPI000829FBA4|nr:Rpn family recombination-promoting nuclease/putative transposase [Nocardia yamanashiensis]